MNSTSTLWRWAGAQLSIRTETPALSDWLARFTGLTPGAPDPAEPDLIRLHGEHEAMVGVSDRQVFGSREELLAWLALTVSDELGRRSESVLLHAASFLVDDSATLVCGQPWAGKSTTALLALNAGRVLLGDDLIRILPGTGTVEACPRPAKLRRIPSSLGIVPGERLLAASLTVTLGTEPCWLLPRQDAGMAPMGGIWPVRRLIHLVRSEEAGFKIEALDRVQAMAALINQVRCNAHNPMRAVLSAIAPLAGLPNHRIHVGPGALPGAFDQCIVCR